MIRGYKGWDIKTVGGTPMLVSPSTGFLWTPGENTAQAADTEADIEAEHNYGFYALKYGHLELVHYGSGGIIGEVILWGRVVEGEGGYKAEKAMVSALFIPSIEPVKTEVLYQLAKIYSVPLVKATGGFYKFICDARNKVLKERGKLPIVDAQEQYRRDWDWMEDRDHRGK